MHNIKHKGVYIYSFIKLFTVMSSNICFATAAIEDGRSPFIHGKQEIYLYLNFPIFKFFVALQEIYRIVLYYVDLSVSHRRAF